MNLHYGKWLGAYVKLTTSEPSSFKGSGEGSVLPFPVISLPLAFILATETLDLLIASNDRLLLVATEGRNEDRGGC